MREHSQDFFIYTAATTALVVRFLFFFFPLPLPLPPHYPILSGNLIIVTRTTISNNVCLICAKIVSHISPLLIFCCCSCCSAETNTSIGICLAHDLLLVDLRKWIQFEMAPARDIMWMEVSRHFVFSTSAHRHKRATNAAEKNIRHGADAVFNPNPKTHTCVRVSTL
ncbi:hypothetical protein TRVL_04548 [Trypanosoma vivax]|nr:hypothetical protein TRVL_04548 [Trypanosoma vivax]